MMATDLPTHCPNCTLPYEEVVLTDEYYSGGYVDTSGVKVPFQGHAVYANGQFMHRDFDWSVRDEWVEEHGELAFDANLELMPKFIRVCGCS